MSFVSKMKGEKNMRKWKKELCALLSMVMIGSSCISLTSEAKEWKNMETGGVCKRWNFYVVRG